MDWLILDPNDAVADGSLAVVQVHVGDAYATSWGNVRSLFYDVILTPEVWFDGTIRCVDATSAQQVYDLYLLRYSERRAVPTDVTMSVTGTYVTGRTFTLRTRVGLEAGGIPKTVRVHMVAVLDYWPDPPANSRNTLRTALLSQDVSLVPGEAVVVPRNVTFDDVSWNAPENIRIIAWAQEPQGSASPSDPATVYQAAVLPWPFPPDCNANGVADAQDIADGTSADVNGNEIPDECEVWVGDLNCDSTVDFRDINPFVLYLTDFPAWQSAFPECNAANGDINGDGTYGQGSFGDINPFVTLLMGES
jgi:hypothetical protein